MQIRRPKNFFSEHCFPQLQKETTNLNELRQQSSVRWLRESPYLYFTGHDKDKFNQFEGALKTIESTRVGRNLIDCIDTIARFKGERIDIVLNTNKLGVAPHDAANTENGRGTGSILYCNFTEVEWLHGSCSEDEKMKFLASVLFHELTHVFHNLAGERVRVISTEQGDERWPELLHEEARTVGLGSFNNEVLTENAFRAEIGLPAREDYGFDTITVFNDDTAMIALRRRVHIFP